MPFKSKAQEGFMFANHPKIAKEFEEKTPSNAKLPEHVAKMAFGGETNPAHETVKSMENNPTAGFADGGQVQEPAFITALRQLLINKGGAAGNDVRQANDANRVEDASIPVTSSDTVKGYDDGGDVQPDDTGTPNVGNMANGMNPPPTPPMGQVMQNMQQMPPTNPSIYQGISANDRAALMQQLLAQQKSGGNLVAQGVAGLGDAISNSFGHGGQKAMANTQDIAKQNTANQAGIVDTQREQRLQDLTGNQTAQMADPNSAISQGMRAFSAKMGVPVPSGMPGSAIMQVLGPAGELAFKQASLANTSMMTQANIANQQQMRQQTAMKNAADIANEQSERTQEAAKSLQARPWYQKAIESVSPLKSAATKAEEAEMGAQTSNQGTVTPNGVKYTVD